MAVKVVDKQGQQEVEVGSAEAQQGFLEGRYVVPAGPVRIARDAHTTGTVDAADLPTALSQGWKVIDDQEHAQLTTEREQDTAAGMALGGVERLVAGATLGGSTYALERLGLVDADEAAARKKAMGGAGTALEVGGAVAASLLTGGGSMALRGGSSLARFAPAAAVERLGVAAERAVGSALGAGRASRVLAPTARGAVEGFAAGVGAEIDESVLGKREIAAEALLGSGLAGALLGGAVGGGLPLAGDVLVGAARAPNAALRRVWGRASGAPGGEGSDAAARALASGSDDWVDRSSRGYAKLLGGDEEAFARTGQRLRTPDGRARLLGDLNKARDTSALQIKSAVDEANAAVDEAVKLTQGGGKLRRVEDLMDGLDNAIAPRHALAHLEQQQAQIARTLAEAGDTIAPELARDLRKAARLVQKATDEAIEGRTGAAAFRAIDNLKREMDVAVQGRAQQYARSGAPEIKETADLLRGLAGQARKHLEAEDVYGKAAVMQREINAAASREFGALAELGKKSPALRKMLERGSEADAATALQLARGYGKVKGQTKVSALDQALDARLEYLKTVQRHHDLPPEAAARIKEAELAVKRMRDQLADQAETAGALDDLWKLREVEGGNSPSITTASTLGPSLGGMLGLGALGLPGAAIGAAAGSVTRPYTTARALAGVLNTVEAFRGAFGRGATLGGLRKPLATAPAVTSAGEREVFRARRTRTVAGAVFGARPGSDDRRKTATKAGELAAQYAANPDALARDVQAQMRAVDEVAPGVATAVGALAAQVVAYLQSHAPSVYQPLFIGGEPMVDPLAAESFARRIEAVADPQGALDLAERGQLTIEHVETLQACYPEHLEEVRHEVTTGLLETTTAGKPVEPWLRVQLGVLLGLPTDVTLLPELLGDLQAVHAPFEASDGETAKPASKPRANMRNSEIGETAKTGMDRVGESLRG